jgi:hypothetical protein
MYDQGQALVDVKGRASMICQVMYTSPSSVEAGK